MTGKITVAKRLVFGFGMLILMLVLAIFFGLERLGALNEMTARLVGKDWQKTVLANDAIALMNANARESFLLFHVPDRAPVRQRMEANKQRIAQKLETIEGLIYRPEGKMLLAAIHERREAYVAAFSKAAGLLDAGNEADAAKMMADEVVPALDALLVSVNKLIGLQGRIFEESAGLAEASYRSARLQMLVGLLASLCFGVALAVWIIRSVVRPLGGEPEDALRVVESVARGDLTTAIAVRPGDSHSLLFAMHGMQASLKKMLAELQLNADGVASASEQLATSSSQVAQATSAQSEAAAAMAAAVEQLTVSIAHVAEQARGAHRLSEETGGLSQEGSGVIRETVDEMHGVSRIVSEAAGSIQAMGDKSQEITGIVQVIREVADQTNLLALNAAIEAARAGEQGRGFAVVADEVRKLAERTAKATAEIGSVIGAVQTSAQSAVATMRQAVSCVEQGVVMARQASDSMLGIRGGAQDVVVTVTEISGALKEQSVVSNDIRTNVESIAQMSEENGAASREVAETAAHLGVLAARSRAAVSRFKVL